MSRIGRGSHAVTHILFKTYTIILIIEWWVRFNDMLPIAVVGSFGASNTIDEYTDDEFDAAVDNDYDSTTEEYFSKDFIYFF